MSPPPIQTHPGIIFPWGKGPTSSRTSAPKCSDPPASRCRDGDGNPSAPPALRTGQSTRSCAQGYFAEMRNSRTPPGGVGRCVQGGGIERGTRLPQNRLQPGVAVGDPGKHQLVAVDVEHAGPVRLHHHTPKKAQGQVTASNGSRSASSCGSSSGPIAISLAPSDRLRQVLPHVRRHPVARCH